MNTYFYYCDNCKWIILSKCFSFIAEPLENGKRKRYHIFCWNKLNK